LVFLRKKASILPNNGKTIIICYKESEGKHDFKLIVHSDDLELFGIPNGPDVHRCKKCGYEKVIEQ
jgi:hypothetical protein